MGRQNQSPLGFNPDQPFTILTPLAPPPTTPQGTTLGSSRTPYYNPDEDDSSDWWKKVKHFGSVFGETVNPLPMLDLIMKTGPWNPDRVEAAKYSLDALKGMGASHAEQFKKAKVMYDQGRYTEAAGHLAAGALPLVGPMAASAGEMLAHEAGYSEEGQGGPDVTGGAAKTLGLLAPFGAAHAVPPVARAATAVARRAAPVAESMGEAAAARSMAPGNAAGIRPYVPQVSRDPEFKAWTRDGLKGEISESLNKASGEFHNAIGQSPRKVPTKPILDAIDREIGELTVKGREDPFFDTKTTIEPARAESNLKALREARLEVEQLGRNAAAADVSKLTQIWESNPLGSGPEGAAYRTVIDATRDYLGQAVPGASVPRARVQLLTTVQDLMEVAAQADTATGGGTFPPGTVRAGVLGALGAGVGYASGYGAVVEAVGAATGAVLGKALQGGTTMQIGVARQLARFADAVKAGKGPTAIGAMTNAAKTAGVDAETTGRITIELKQVWDRWTKASNKERGSIDFGAKTRQQLEQDATKVGIDPVGVETEELRKSVAAKVTQQTFSTGTNPLTGEKKPTAATSVQVLRTMVDKYGLEEAARRAKMGVEELKVRTATGANTAEEVAVPLRDRVGAVRAGRDLGLSPEEVRKQSGAPSMIPQAAVERIQAVIAKKRQEGVDLTPREVELEKRILQERSGGASAADDPRAVAMNEARLLGIDPLEFPKLEDLQWAITRKTAQQTAETGVNPLTGAGKDKTAPVMDESGRVIAPPQTEIATRPPGPWDANGPTRPTAGSVPPRQPGDAIRPRSEGNPKTVGEWVDRMAADAPSRVPDSTAQTNLIANIRSKIVELRQSVSGQKMSQSVIKDLEKVLTEDMSPTQFEAKLEGINNRLRALKPKKSVLDRYLDNPETGAVDFNAIFGRNKEPVTAEGLRQKWSDAADEVVAKARSASKKEFVELERKMKQAKQEYEDFMSGKSHGEGNTLPFARGAEEGKTPRHREGESGMVDSNALLGRKKGKPTVTEPERINEGRRAMFRELFKPKEVGTELATIDVPQRPKPAPSVGQALESADPQTLQALAQREGIPVEGPDLLGRLKEAAGGKVGEFLEFLRAPTRRQFMKTVAGAAASTMLPDVPLSPEAAVNKLVGKVRLAADKAGGIISHAIMPRPEGGEFLVRN